jgi:hypothetical protein
MISMAVASSAFDVVRSPDMAPFVMHFTGRSGQPNGSVEPAVRSASPKERLRAILEQGVLRAFPIFGSTLPVTCFAECTVRGAEGLLSAKRFLPWGIALRKALLFAHQGGPALYVRGDEWNHVPRLPEQLRARAIRYSPDGVGCGAGGYADWTHEREWRCLADVRFSPRDVVFVLVPMPFELPDWLSGLPLVRFDPRVGQIRDPRGVWAW